MPIKPTTPKSALQASINNRLARIRQALINVMMYAGEEVVKYARDPYRKRYTDQTGNLTSSIGYVVLDNGTPVHISDFQPVAGKADKGNSLTGSRKGKEFIQKMMSEYGQGIVLIVVAGMPYAPYVEAKGYDVLDSAEIKADEIVKRLLRKLKF